MANRYAIRQEAYDKGRLCTYDFQEVMQKLLVAREDLAADYPDLSRREFKWRAFQQLATESLGASVEQLTCEPYRQQVADVLDAAVNQLGAFQLTDRHFSAIDFTLSCLLAQNLTEEEVDACEDLWRVTEVDTIPSLRDSFGEWLASAENAR